MAGELSSPDVFICPSDGQPQLPLLTQMATMSLLVEVRQAAHSHESARPYTYDASLDCKAAREQACCLAVGQHLPPCGVFVAVREHALQMCQGLELQKRAWRAACAWAVAAGACGWLSWLKVQMRIPQAETVEHCFLRRAQGL